MKHTPGPWRVLDGAILSENLNSFGNFIVTESPQRNKEDKANAYLIAACPELLEATDLSMDVMANILTWAKLTDYQRERLTEATNACSMAIAKAAGGTNEKESS